MPRSTLTSKGQTTIPLQVRERLGLRQGDAIDFVFQPDGSVTLRRASRDVRSLEGFLHRPGMKPVSLEDMDAAVRRAVTARYVRTASTRKSAGTRPGRRRS